MIFNHPVTVSPRLLCRFFRLTTFATLYQRGREEVIIILVQDLDGILWSLRCSMVPTIKHSTVYNVVNMEGSLR